MHALVVFAYCSFFVERQQGARGGKGNEEKERGGNSKGKEREKG